VSVRSTALRLAIACRKAMPDAKIDICHHPTSWGFSSYVHIRFGATHTAARVSDHGIGARRYYSDPVVTLYLRDGAVRGAWELWLADLAARYHAAGGTVPAPGGLFADLTPPAAGAISQA